MSDELVSALTALELREARLLGRGVHDGSLTREEVLGTFVEAGVEDPEEVFASLSERAALVEAPDGRIRSRMAEGVHMMASSRQWFPRQRSWDAPQLVVDYRFLHAPRRRPMLSHSMSEVVEEVERRLPSHGADAVAAMCKPTVSAFQLRSVVAVLDGLAASTDRGVVVSAGTGSGKTLAFYLPALSWIVESLDRSPAPSVKALALYPRNELLKDQLRTAVRHSLDLRKQGVGARALRLGTWFGGTPRAGYWLQQGWSSWEVIGKKSAPDGWRCPFLDCPTDDCEGHLMWSAADVQAQREVLRCVDCAFELRDDVLCLTRASAMKRPPDVMFTTTESLNRQLSAPDTHRAFGLADRPSLRVVLLDEVHTYEGTTGAQNAYLLRRLRNIVGSAPVLFAGLSATLLRAQEFFAQFTGVPDAEIEVVEPSIEEMEDVGAEYQIALRHNPASQTGPLSATIQSVMALQRTLDARSSDESPNPFASVATQPDSRGIFGSRTFVFTDKLDVTNRLFWDLLDAEGWWDEGKPKERMPSTLAHLRSADQLRLTQSRREAVEERADDGQYWWLANLLGHDIEDDHQLSVGRTSSQDQGVSDSDVIVATATLEVGYDDDRVGAVLQHKAPHDPARFLQRKGRAGRTISMRPWTVVVLSDFGRDRLAFESYDQLFNPQLEATRLPLGNRYVLKMQAVYSTLDWLAACVADSRPDRNVWADLAGPAEAVESRSEARAVHRAGRQRRLAEVITSVLHGGPERAGLTRHLGRALRISDREVDTVLWGAPRPLLLAVLPTALRRLEQEWDGEVPTSEDIGLRTRTPLREFIAGNLFDDLLVSDVRLVLPADGQSGEPREEGLPIARVLQEFLPGNVSRHFGIRSFGRRHWIPNPDSGVVSIEDYGGRFLRTVPSTGGDQVRVYEPRRLELALPAQEIKDSTSSSPVWEVDIEAVGEGTRVSLPAQWSEVLPELRFRMHADGDAVRVARFTRGSRGTIRTRDGVEPTACRFVDGDGDAALGLEVEVDGIDFDIDIPSLEPITSLERSLRLRALIDLDPRTAPLHNLQRSSLAQALLLTLAAHGGTDLVGAWTNRELSSELRATVTQLGLRSAQAGAAAPPVEVDADVSERLMDLGEAIESDDVLDAIQGVLGRVSGARDSDWERWQRRRIAAAAASVVLDAASRLVPTIDAEELTVDVTENSETALRVWLCESGPGGNGTIEALYGAVSESTVGLRRLIHASLMPGGLDALATELDELLGSPKPELSHAVEQIRLAWASGHRAVEEAMDQLAGVAPGMSPTAVASTATRLASPGASPHLPSAVRRLLADWNRMETSSGFAVDLQVFSAIAAVTDALDHDLGLTNADARIRMSSVARLIWPRSLSLAGAEDRGRIFGDRLPADLAALSAYLPEPWRTVRCDSVEDARSAVQQLLPSDGAVALRFDDGSIAKQSATSLLGEPVEVDALLVYPRILSAALVPTIELVFASTELVG